MDVQLLRRVRQHIATHPHRFCAAQWAFAANARAVLTRGARPEGFRGCLAAHALLLAGAATEADLLRRHAHFDNGTLSAAARAVLGLSAEQARELFYPACWPAPFREAYYATATPEEEAALAAALLDAFLARHAPALPAPDRAAAAAPPRSTWSLPARSLPR